MEEGFLYPIEMTKSYKQNIKGDKNSTYSQRMCDQAWKPLSPHQHVKGSCEDMTYIKRLVQCLAHSRCLLPTKC